MPVPINDIEIQIEKAVEIVNNEKWEYSWDTFENLAKLLDQQLFLPIEYFYPFERLIKSFDEKGATIPAKLYKAFDKALIKFELNTNNSEELTKSINDCLNIVDILGINTEL